MLSAVVKAIGQKWNFRVPYNGAVETAYNTTQGKVMVDIAIPMDKNIKARQPDLVVRKKRENQIWILDMACAWDPLIAEREKEKIGKYRAWHLILEDKNHSGW